MCFIFKLGHSRCRIRLKSFWRNHVAICIVTTNIATSALCLDEQYLAVHEIGFKVDNNKIFVYLTCRAYILIEHHIKPLCIFLSCMTGFPSFSLSFDRSLGCLCRSVSMRARARVCVCASLFCYDIPHSFLLIFFPLFSIIVKIKDHVCGYNICRMYEVLTIQLQCICRWDKWWNG